jgi:1-aminocyclopropane-1-carboxylate deaminase
VNTFLEKFNLFHQNKSLLQQIVFEETIEKKVNIFVKRDDLIHHLVMGNKWRKLKYNLLEAHKLGLGTILTFGGAFSNHLLATAAAGHFFGFKTIGIVRGEELTESSNSTLIKCSELGMELVFVEREVYKRRSDVKYHDELMQQFGSIYIVPEGGNNDLAIKGCGEIVEELPFEFDYYCTSCGTGSTAAGLAKVLPDDSKLVVFPALKQMEEQSELICTHSKSNENVVFVDKYIFGGYAKSNQLLIDFINHFPIKLDEVYTSKLFYGVFDLIKNNYFESGSKILIYHSGGYR